MYLPIDLADPQADLVLAGQAPFLARRGGGDGLEQALGRLQQVLALARPLGGQQRIAAHHQAFAGIGVAADLDQVGLVEQRHLHRPRFHQLADGGRAQGANPVEARRFHVLADARLGQHAAVAHQHYAVQPEAVAQLVDLRAHGHRIGRVAVEHLDRHRAPLAVAQQAELDLQLAALAVAAMAALGQRTAAAFQVAGGQVVEHQCAVGEMALGQAPLDGVLAFEQPVHGGVEIVLVGVLDVERLGERVARGGLCQAPGGGQFRARIEDACGDQGNDALALGGGGAGDGAVEAQLLQGAEHGGDMAVG